MARFNVGACMPCRTRKVKCDGQFGMCGPCQRARSILHCTYDPSGYVEIRPQKRSLQRGSACAPCRKKKKRCNAGRPFCDICHKSGEENQCQYDDSRLAVGQTSPKDTGRLRRIASATQKVEHMKEKLSAVRPSNTGTDSPLAELVQFSVLRPLQQMTYWFSSSEVVPFHTIPDPCHFIGTLAQNQLFSNYLVYDHDPIESALMDSSQSLNDMDMTFRLIFLAHRLQVGYRFSTIRTQAVICGDLDNTVIHPFFIYFAQLFGCNLHQERKGEYCYLYTMCIYLRLAREAFATMSEEDDPLSYAEACHFWSIWCIYNHNATLGKYYFVRAVEVVKRHNIRFVSQSFDSSMQLQDPSESWPYCSEEVIEKVVFLSQLLYLQLHLRHIVNDMDDLCYDLRQQFLEELPLTYPTLYKVSPVVMRVRTMIVGTEATVLVLLYRAQKISPSFINSCRAWLLSMELHVDFLVSQLALFEMLGDQDCCTLLRYSCCFCLAALSEVDKNLREHSSSPYAPLLLGCQFKSSEILDKITKATEGIVQPDDVAFMGLLFETFCSSISQDKSPEMQLSNAIANLWPLLRPDSIFLNTTIQVMSHYQNKLASVRIDW